MTQRIITIIAGRDFNKSGDQLQEEAVQKAITSIRQELAIRFGGFSETHGIGGWVNHDSQLVQERTVKYEVLTDRLQDGAAEAAAEMVRSALDQYSVVLSVRKTEYMFVEVK